MRNHWASSSSARLRSHHCSKSTSFSERRANQKTCSGRFRPASGRNTGTADSPPRLIPGSAFSLKLPHLDTVSGTKVPDIGAVHNWKFFQWRRSQRTMQRRDRDYRYPDAPKASLVILICVPVPTTHPCSWMQVAASMPPYSPPTLATSMLLLEP